ncbi:Gfo/Idh/MocA family oxidoreductase [Fulvivirga lutea]|uniref:Gfo/Idh/MocA family oxidoreductase n=2 Tax=Fulvivirga lutea TaxID=2810512 RepID=A0A975A2F4_9BACT|nr:Gfo/Idh/MocA family oxidoreductase [Fulvivirga lutea]QSE99414.1 Gfo/Idh/MocA family oxidoreductase [Fulvivirga lutea]
MKNFALIGAAGYIAPRHFKAIRETKNNLVASLDVFDSVGVIDSYFPNSDFFTEFERFDRHLDKLRRNNVLIDYLTVCSPNYLHDSHIRFGLRNGANVICEKPLVLNPWNLDALEEIENESGKRIFNILQLRHHPSMIALKENVNKSGKDKFDVTLTYITSRGNWYYTSWKGEESKSGGIATNIGIHFFDILGWIFGDIEDCKVHVHSHDRAAGFLEFKRARVKWFLSINSEHLPSQAIDKNLKTFRTLTIDGESIEFSQGFTELHTVSYSKILENEGFGINEARKAVELTHEIRNFTPIGLINDYHEMAKFKLTTHPFKLKK